MLFLVLLGHVDIRRICIPLISCTGIPLVTYPSIPILAIPMCIPTFACMIPFQRESCCYYLETNWTRQNGSGRMTARDNYVRQIFEQMAFSLTVSTRRRFLLSAMASVLKAQKSNASKADLKGKGKRKAEDMDVDEDEDVAVELPPSKMKKNKQRVLLLSSRGITHRMRHLMNDLEALLPHVKKGELISRVVFRAYTEKSINPQTRSSIPNLNSISFLNLPTSTTAITLCTLRLADMKIYTSGRRRRRMDRALKCMYKMCIPWTSSR